MRYFRGRSLSRLAAVLLLSAAFLGLPAKDTRSLAAEDARELVQLPEMMQAHMLQNMRDHLLALDEMLAALATGDVDTAAKVAEARLGMSSMGLHGAAHMAQFMPEGMRAAGTGMHQAASRFVTIARDAELSPGLEAQHQVYEALQAITAQCNACHAAYRIR